VFHHPLIRAVAYEAQLKSDRADLHRRVASVIEQRDHDSVGESAALIAEHLEAAGDLRSAYAWHMRAGAWSSNRGIRAARISWERARRVADALPANDPERTAMRIRPRTLLCATTWRAGLGVPTPVSTSFVGCAAGCDLPQPAPTRRVCGASREKRCNVVGEGVEDGAAAWGRIDGRLSSSGANSARVIR
jgi:hypothetical protein